MSGVASEASPDKATAQRPTFIHVHIPKTAGTTINAVLGSAIKGRHFAYSQPGQRQAFEAMSQDERDGIDFVFGHFPYGLHRSFTRPVRYIASVREPRQRMLSFYHYVLATDDHPRHELVKAHAADFSSFLKLAAKHSGLRDEVDNLQVRMIAGQLQLQSDYSDVLSVALSNITGGGFYVTEMQRVGEFLPWLERTTGLTFGLIPRLNASGKSVSLDDEMTLLDREARDVLERFGRWDAILSSVVRDVAPADLQRMSSSVRAVAGSTAATGDISAQQLISALYRVLLLREPDANGLEARITLIRAGRPIEDIMRHILKSPEFRDKHEQFLQTYLGPAAEVRR